jgi:DNA-binding beta-propeller fold protein YncE
MTQQVLLQVHSLAVDWVAGNLYWTDAVYNHIVVSTLSHRFLRGDTLVRGQVAVVSTDIREPWGVAVHPAKR